MPTTTDPAVNFARSYIGHSNITATKVGDGVGEGSANRAADKQHLIKHVGREVLKARAETRSSPSMLTEPRGGNASDV